MKFRNPDGILTFILNFFALIYYFLGIQLELFNLIVKNNNDWNKLDVKRLSLFELLYSKLFSLTEF